MFKNTFAHINTFMTRCMRIQIYACKYVKYVNMYTCKNVNMHLFIRTFVHIYIHVHMSKCKYVFMNMQLCKYSTLHVYIHVYTKIFVFSTMSICKYVSISLCKK